MSHVRLLSTDFDGTLIGFNTDLRCPPALAEAISAHHSRGGRWAINTGRGLPHILEGLESFAPPVMPDFLLIYEREIYRREGDEWSAYGDWNDHCRKRHEELYLGASQVFADIHDLAATSSDTVTVLYEGELPVGLVTATEEVMETVAQAVSRTAAALPGFGFQRNAIYMRFCHADYHKGSALRELCRLEGIAPADVFAAGDHHNDLSMLDGTHAALTACPSNAIEEVKEAVRRSGGYVAARPSAHGIAEALRHFGVHSPREE